MENLKIKYNEYGTKIYCTSKTIIPRFIRFEKKARNHVFSDKKAQGIIEYGLIIALVSLGVLGGVMYLRNSIIVKLNSAAADITSKT